MMGQLGLSRQSSPYFLLPHTGNRRHTLQTENSTFTFTVEASKIVGDNILFSYFEGNNNLHLYECPNLPSKASIVGDVKD